MFFSFFRSRGGSLRALITREEAEGTTETAAWRFWMVSLTVTRRPFYKFANSSASAPNLILKICIPNLPLPLQYLLPLSLGTILTAQSWEPKMMRRRPLLRWLSCSCGLLGWGLAKLGGVGCVQNLNLTRICLGSYKQLADMIKQNGKQHTHLCACDGSLVMVLGFRRV